MHWLLGIVIALFGSMATAQEEEEEQEQTPVCYDMNTDADVVENVCFPRIDGYSLRTALDEGGWEETHSRSSAYAGFWYGNIVRTASAYYGAADPEDQLESRVLVVHVTASAGFPLHRRTRSPGAHIDSWRWGYESGIEVTAYLMTAAHNDPTWDGLGRPNPYYKVVLKDNGNLVIEDCPLDPPSPWSATVSGGGSALEPRVAPDTEWPLKVSRMIRRYLEQEEAPAACS